MFNFFGPFARDPVEQLLRLYRITHRGGSGQITTVTGISPLVLLNALHKPIHKLIQYGLCTQDGTPTPDAPVDIVCNNGAIKLRRQSGLPIAYQMVEWLKPTGAVLITDFKTKSTQEIETVFYRERSGANYLYSSDTATGGTTNTTAYLTSGAGNWRWDGKSYSIGVQVGIKFTSIQNKDGVWFNGTRVGWYTDAGEFVSTYDLRLSSGENTTVRIYSMTIREGETVTLDLVPVQRVTDNAYGFYDKVSGNFYTNADATFEVGDQIPDPVEIYTDGTAEVLTVRGKNLFDQSLFDTTSTQVKYTTYEIPNGIYTMSSPDMPAVSGGTANVFILAGEATSGASSNANGVNSRAPRTITVTDGKYTVAYRSSLSSNPNNPADFKWQLEQGSTATDYEPYVTPQTVSVPMLLSVGDYRDEAELISGIKTGKVGVKVFDGTEAWRASSSANIYILDNAIAVNLTAICTHFKKVANSTSATNMTDGSFKGHSSNSILYFKDVSAGDVDGFKARIAAQYAAGTPVIMLYSLATEQTEQTTPHALHTSEGTVIVDVTANVSPVELEVEYTAAAAAAGG